MDTEHPLRTDVPPPPAVLGERERARLRRFLLVPATGIGDTVQFTPVITGLGEAFPGAELHAVAGSRAAASLLENHPGIRSVEVLGDRSAPGWLSFALRSRLRTGPVDAILAAAGVPFFIPTVFGSKVAVAFQGREGRSLLGGGTWISLIRNLSLNEVEENLRLLGPLGIERPDTRTRVGLGEEDTKYARDLFDRPPLAGRGLVVAFHTGCDTPEKEWGQGNFGSLISALLENMDDVGVILLGGPGEDAAPVLAQVARTVRNERIVDITGRTGIRQAAAILEKSDLLVSNDSGLAHLAAAVGTPVLVLFGPSDPRRTAPWATDAGVSIVRAGIECSPCYQLYSGRISCRFGAADIRCMKAIGPDEVLQNIISLLDTTPARSSSS